MANEIIALALGLMAGMFFFLGATFPVLAIPLISIAVTGASTLFIFAILKFINTLQTADTVLSTVREDAQEYYDEKYEDVTKQLYAQIDALIETINTTFEAKLEKVNTTLEANLEKANTTLVSLKTDTIAALQTTTQQELNRAKLSIRKALATYNHMLLLSDHTNEGLQSEPNTFKVPQILGYLAGTCGAIGAMTGGLLGLPLMGAALGAGTFAYSQYQPHKKAFLKKIADNKLQCKFLNDQNEIQEAIFDVDFLQEDTELTEALVTQHETLILEYINLNIIQQNVISGVHFAKPENIEPIHPQAPKEQNISLLELLATQPILFRQTRKKKVQHNKAGNDSRVGSNQTKKQRRKNKDEKTKTKKKTNK